MNRRDLLVRLTEVDRDTDLIRFLFNEHWRVEGDVSREQIESDLERLASEGFISVVPGKDVWQITSAGRAAISPVLGASRTADPFGLALALLVVGMQPPEDLPDVATAAILAGVESPSLAQLSGLPRSEYQEARDLFFQAMEELGLDRPSPSDARWTIVRQWASDIVAGALSPIEGAQRIQRDGWNELGRPEELTVFVGLADQWSDDPPHWDELEAEIIEAARNLVSA